MGRDRIRLLFRFRPLTVSMSRSRLFLGELVARASPSEFAFSALGSELNARHPQYQRRGLEQTDENVRPLSVVVSLPSLEKATDGAPGVGQIDQVRYTFTFVISQTPVSDFHNLRVSSSIISSPGGEGNRI